MQESISVEILDVLLYTEKKRHRRTASRSFYALSFRLSGESVFHLSGDPLRAESGSIVFVPQGIDYDRTTDGESIAVFHFRMRETAPLALSVYMPNEPERYRMLFLEALRIWEEKPRGYRFSVTSIFYRILAMMTEDGFFHGEEQTGLAERAAEEIQRRFRETGLSVSVLADALYVSEAYLRRKFRERYGMSPKRYLDAVRIENAVSLLRTGYYTQKEIADRCGYSDVKYFRTAFKARTGYTPSEYIKCDERGTEGMK